MKNNILINILSMLLPLLCFSQEVTRTRQEVINSMDEYLYYYYYDIDDNHTNKWQNNYYDNDGYYNSSTFLNYEGSWYGAPYGYGVKDDLITLENKMRGNSYDLSYTEEQSITLIPGLWDSDSTDEFIITTTRYLFDDCLVLDINVDDDDAYWQLILYNVGFGYIKNQNYIYNVRTEIWSSEWQSGDCILFTDPIEFTGKYYLKMETTSSWDLIANITLTKPQTVPHETYACGSHYNHYQICSQLGLPLPTQWAFGIDCSGFVSWGYGLPIASYGTAWYAQNFYPIDYYDTEMADYLVWSGHHIVMIENKFGDYINIYHSVGELEPADKPDGTILEFNKDIYRDYIQKGYQSRSPWYPTGIEDYIFIELECPRVIEQNELIFEYVAHFVDSDQDGDYIEGNWHWQLIAYHDAGYEVLHERFTEGQTSTSTTLWVTDLDSFDVTNWTRTTDGNVQGNIILSATDSDGYPHYTNYEVEILAEPNQPQITNCYGNNQSVTLSFMTACSDSCHIYYDTISGPPYNGTGADQGDSPFKVFGDTVTTTLTGLINNTTYYFAIKAYNEIGETDYSNEHYATPITTSGTMTCHETWPGAGNPDTVNITGDVIVNQGVTLTVEPNATILFSSNKGLRIKGKLSADNTIFDAVNPANIWKGIRFDDCCDDNSYLDYCDIKHAYDGIEINGASPTITNCNITDNTSHGLYLTNSEADIKFCNISGNFIGITCTDSYANDWGIEFDNNEINNNSAQGIILINSSPTIKSSEICENGQEGIVCYDQSESSIRKCTINENNKDGLRCINNSSPQFCKVGDSSWNFIQYNGQHGVLTEDDSWPELGYERYPGYNQICFNNDKQVYNDNGGSAYVYAQLNWWGTGSPGSDLFHGRVKYIPYWGEEPEKGNPPIVGEPEIPDPKDEINYTIYTGIEHYSSDDFNKAIADFEYVIANYPDSSQAQFALTYIFKCFYEMEKSARFYYI